MAGEHCIALRGRNQKPRKDLRKIQERISWRTASQSARAVRSNILVLVHIGIVQLHEILLLGKLRKPVLPI
jgi:hypothetical protein